VRVDVSLSLDAAARLRGVTVDVDVAGDERVAGPRLVAGAAVVEEEGRELVTRTSPGCGGNMLGCGCVGAETVGTEVPLVCG
jgi:hypothetical protein